MVSGSLPSVERSPTPVVLEPPAVERLGLIALSTDMTFERDAARLLPATRTVLHVTRVRFDNPTTPENLRRMAPRIGEAAALIVPGVPLAAICFACTSAAVEIGDAAVEAAIGTARPGVPVVTPPAAAVRAFGALGVRRIALVTPYLPETTTPMVAYFEAHGLEVVSAHCLGLADDRDMACLSAATIEAAALAADDPRAEAVFLSCTALPALGVIPTLEARLEKPVVSSNQASLWQMLAHAGVGAVPEAPGRLFRSAAMAA